MRKDASEKEDGELYYFKVRKVILKLFLLKESYNEFAPNCLTLTGLQVYCNTNLALQMKTLKIV
jgi:hypothetical protein